jgi:hypothetical protein
MVDYGNISVQLAYPNNLYGYNLFLGIYNNLINAINDPYSEYNLRLRLETDKAISDKLNNFKILEDELIDELANKLHIVSKGIINPSQIPREKLPELLAKHSNLLQKIIVYNQKAISLSKILEAINNKILEKSDKGYFRPMKMDY